MEVDSWKLEKRKSKNLLKQCSANANQVPNAKNLSTLFRGLHFYPAKTTIKHPNKTNFWALLTCLLGISNVCIVDFPKYINLPTPTFSKDLEVRKTRTPAI